MKLRIRDNSVRLRLTQTEVKNFAETGAVESRTVFGDGSVFGYALKTIETSTRIEAEFANGRIEIRVPPDLAENWATSDEVGLEAENRGVKIMIEKDFACLTERPHEDESDAFPHPREQEKTC